MTGLGPSSWYTYNLDVLGANPIALLTSPYFVNFTCPEPPITDPYIVNIKKNVDTPISTARLPVDSLEPI